MNIDIVSKPLNVWYSDGVKYIDYRLDDGRIVTVEDSNDVS